MRLARLLPRPELLRRALRLEVLSLFWVLTEVVVGVIAAQRAGSLAISAFSIDSAIELLSGIVLFTRISWELRSEDSDAIPNIERIASAVVGISLLLLAAWTAFESGRAFAAASRVETSGIGLALAAVSSLLTPWLARRKRHLGLLLHSHALLGDAACSATCGYMAWTLLTGLVAQWAFGWWWVDAVAALGIVYFITREAWESLSSAWTGVAHVHH